MTANPDEKIVVATATPTWDARSPDLLPKEAWLLGKIREDTAAGRGVGVYLQYIHGRGLPERLLWLLAREGFRAAIIPQSIKPARRDGWIKKQLAGGLQVLLTHPGKVETGLDLLAFQTLVFYQIPYSLITAEQAKKRAYRIVQTEPCEVWFPYYSGTMQHRALALLHEKMKAQAVLTGADSPGALLDNDSGNSGFIEELARDAVKGAKVDDLGVMLRRSGSLVEWTDEALTQAEELLEMPRRMVEPVSGAQVSFFDLPPARQEAAFFEELAERAAADGPLPDLDGVLLELTAADGKKVARLNAVPLNGVQQSLF